MPIKQDRMIKVINAGMEYKACLSQLKAMVDMVLEEAQREGWNQEKLIYKLGILKFAVQPAQSIIMPLEIEALWFNRMASRNTKEAKRHARRRAREGGENIPYGMGTGGQNYTRSALELEREDNPLERAVATATPEDRAAYALAMMKGAQEEAPPPAAIEPDDNQGPKDPAATMAVVRDITEGEELGL